VDWAALDRGAAALVGSAGLIALDAEGTVLYERAADDAFPAASVIKIPILMTVYADAAEGRLSLDERLAVGEHLPGTGVLGWVRGVTELTIRDHATLMTIVSDNTSTNRLMERVGVERIAERMREWGCVRTQLRRKMFDFEAANRGLDNVACPRELAGLLLRPRARRGRRPIDVRRRARGARADVRRRGQSASSAVLAGAGAGGAQDRVAGDGA